jgi:hypothetical protein
MVPIVLSQEFANRHGFERAFSRAEKLPQHRL